MDYKDIGQRVRTERTKLNMSREKLAELIELSPVYIGQIERGERKMSLETMCKLSGYLNISLDYLVKGHSTVLNNIDLVSMQNLINNLPVKEANLIIDVLAAILKNLNDSSL